MRTLNVVQSLRTRDCSTGADCCAPDVVWGDEQRQWRTAGACCNGVRRDWQLLPCGLCCWSNRSRRRQWHSLLSRRLVCRGIWCCQLGHLSFHECGRLRLGRSSSWHAQAYRGDCDRVLGCGWHRHLGDCRTCYHRCNWRSETGWAAESWRSWLNWCHRCCDRADWAVVCQLCHGWSRGWCSWCCRQRGRRRRRIDGAGSL